MWRTKNDTEKILLFTNVLASSILKYCVSREEIFWEKLTSRSSSTLTVRLPATEKGL